MCEPRQSRGGRKLLCGTVPMAAASVNERFGADVYGAPVPDIEADSPVTCVAMHPLADVCALATVSGTVEL